MSLPPEVSHLTALAATIAFVVASCADNPVQPAATSLPVSAVSLNSTVGCQDYDAATGYCWDDWNYAECDYANPTSWCYDPCFPEWCDPGTVLIGACDPAVEPCPEGGGGGGGDGGDDDPDTGDDGDSYCPNSDPNCRLELRPQDSAKIDSALTKVDTTRAICREAFLKAKQLHAKGHIYRGNPQVPDSSGAHHDGQSRLRPDPFTHIDQDFLESSDLAGLAGLMLHEMWHLLAYKAHPRDEDPP